MTLQEAIAILRSPEGKDETRRVFRLGRVVDLAVRLIEQREVDRVEAEALVDRVAGIAEELFPGSGDTFAIVYGRRFSRVIAQTYGAGN